LLNRVFKSIKDGSFAFKALNRVSHTKYVPARNLHLDHLDEFLAEHYSGDGWKLLSPGAKQMWIDLSSIFSTVPIENIAYVGANDGQVALSMEEAFPKRNFYLVEPVQSTFQKLVGNVGSRPNMKCFNLAAGAKEESLDMFVDDFSAASSLLAYDDRALREFPFLGHTRTLKVQVKALDDILQSCAADHIDMLIMDVQGYEDRVLEGAERTLRSCKVIMSELSLQELYSGSSTFHSVYQALVNKEFYLRQLMNPLKGANQTILQIDGIFVRALKMRHR
jgi:FkbM family methyltransferase